MIGKIVYAFIQFYLTLILIYAIMSWFPSMRESNFRMIIGRMVEPYIQLYRGMIPPIFGIDFSVLFAYIVLDICALTFLMLF